MPSFVCCHSFFSAAVIGLSFSMHMASPATTSFEPFRVASSMSWRSWMPLTEIWKWLNKASESLRMSKKTLGMVGDSRMVLREIALLFVVEKAVSPRLWIFMR